MAVQVSFLKLSRNPLVIAYILAGTIVAYFLIKPIAEYFWDAKGLRKYPNQNFLSGFTNLGQIYERHASFRTANLYEAHKKHPIIRTGPTALSFRDVKAIRDIYGHSSPCLKDDMYVAMTGSHTHMFNVIDKPEHARKRKLLSNAFATKNLVTWEYKVVDKVERLLRQFDRLCDSAKYAGEQWVSADFQRWSNFFTIDAIADIGISYKLHALDRANDTVSVKLDDGHTVEYPYIESLHAQNRPTSILVWATKWFSTLRLITKLTSSWYRAQYRIGAQFGRIIHYLAQNRIASHTDGEKLDDFFHSLMEDRHGTPIELELGEIEAEMSLLLDAGSETTSIALTNVMHHLLRNPEKLAKLREEIDCSIDPNEKITSFTVVRQLPYLKACIDENLRLTPSIPYGLPRKTPPDGTSIAGDWIAGGVTVSLPAYIAHRDPELFPCPEDFVPERWLDENIKQVLPYYIPFSTGSRGCIGRNIAYLELHVLTAALLKRYDIRLEEPGFELEREDGHVLWTGPLPILFQRRE